MSEKSKTADLIKEKASSILFDLITDIRFLESFRPDMIGLGPFLPHHDTPFRDCPAGSADLTLRIYSILRLMIPCLYRVCDKALPMRITCGQFSCS